MLIRETDTDFDKHLKMLEDSEGQVFFLFCQRQPCPFQEESCRNFYGA